MLQEKVRIGALHEVELFAERRVIRPKTVVASEIRQPRISAHPRASANQHHV